MGVLEIRALVFGVQIRPGDFWKLTSKCQIRYTFLGGSEVWALVCKWFIMVVIDWVKKGLTPQAMTK